MPDLFHWVRDKLFDGGALILAPEYLLICLPVAWLVYRRTAGEPGFWRWLLPAAIYRHRSSLIDLELFAMGRLMALFGIVGKVTGTTAVAGWIAGLWPHQIADPATLSPVTLALLLWVLSDLATYWMHRAYHRSPFLWPLHAVHHSAEVLTPLTTYRQHPGSILVSTAAQSLGIGLCQGLLIGTIAPGTSISEIAGVNAFVVLANAGFSALHHSHVWLSYGPVIERIVMSPAQHQIHHSVNPDHHNRNYGTSLALWDWLFGTLYVIRAREVITFGLTDKADAPLMTHRLWPILMDPLQRMLRR